MMLPLPAGFRDLGLTIAGAQMAVTMNLFFLALGAASTAVMSHVNTTYVCPLGNNPSRYWWYMVSRRQRAPTWRVLFACAATSALAGFIMRR